MAGYYHKASAPCSSLSPPAGGFFLSFQPCHAALVIDLKAAARGPLAFALHGSHSALKAARFAVLVWHTGRVTKHPIALFVLSAVADPESFLGQQQIVVKNNPFAALARHIRAGIQRHIAHKMISLPTPEHITAVQHMHLVERQIRQLGGVKMSVHQRCNIIGDIYMQANGALFLVGPKGMNVLEIYLDRIVVKMLLRIKYLLTKSGQICQLESMVNALVKQRLIDLLLCLEVDLLLIVIDPGKPDHHDTEVFIDQRCLICMRASHHNPSRSG